MSVATIYICEQCDRAVEDEPTNIDRSDCCQAP